MELTQPADPSQKLLQPQPSSVDAAARIPCAVAPWALRAATVILDHAPTLENVSQLMCAWCGQIQHPDAEGVHGDGPVKRAWLSLAVR